MKPKSWIKNALAKTGVLRLGSNLFEQGVAIIMYHSVMDDPLSAEQTMGGIIHSTQVFRRQMEIVAADFHAVSLNDVLRFLNGEATLPRRAVVVTFDDGYADNYQVANDILAPLGIPGAFYVTVDCIDKQRLPWPSLLRYAFMKSGKDSWSEPDGATWPLLSIEHRMQAFERAAEYCSKLSGIPQDRFVELRRQELETEPPNLTQRLIMNWDEVRGLVRSGHTVGSHTMTHPNVAHISEADVQRELGDAKHRLEQELAIPIVHFSYPCPALQPHWAERTVSAARELGYQTAVTVDRGVVRKDANPFSLPRIRPTKTVDGLRWNLESAFLARNV